MSECRSVLLLRFEFIAYAARAPPNFCVRKRKQNKSGGNYEIT